MVLEKEEGLDKCEEKVHHIDENKDSTLAVLSGGGLEVRGDIEAIQSHTAERKG